MQKLLTYSKLTILDAITVVAVTVCSMFILFENMNTTNVQTVYVLACSTPIILSLLFTIFDVAYIANYRDIEDSYREMYRSASRSKRKKLTKVQRTITYIINIIAIIVLIFSSTMFFTMKYISITEAMASYTILFILSLFHIYLVNRKT